MLCDPNNNELNYTCIYQIIITFSMGAHFAENLPRRGRAVMFICLFCCMAPVGVSMGLLVSSFKTGELGAIDVVEGVLQVLS